MANSRRKCKRCEIYSDAATGIKTPAGFFCSHSHAIEFAIAKTDKARKLQLAKSRKRLDAQAKEARKVDRQRKMDVKPLSYWAKRSQDAFNAFIRERDSGLPCVSCGHPDDGSRQRHASHYRSVGASPSTRFMEINVHASCSICNNWLSGNIGQYKAELIRRIGQDEVDFIESQIEPKRYRKEDYQQIEADYKAKLKALRMEREGVNQA